MKGLKKYKWLFSVGMLLVIGVVLLVFYTENKKEEMEKTGYFVEKEPQDEEVGGVEEPAENEVVGKTTDGTVLYSQDKLNITEPRLNHFDGGREPVEQKKDYTDILGVEPILFEPVFPDSVFKEKTLQADRIEGYLEKQVADRIKLLKTKKDFTTEEKVEWNKIDEVNKKMSDAFIEGDYNNYMRHMYKGWREFYGVTVGAVINSGEFKEELIAFYPERIDLEIGIAHGLYVRETVYYLDELAVDVRLTDGFIMYKQDAGGNWEVYLESPLFVPTLKEEQTDAVD